MSGESYNLANMVTFSYLEKLHCPNIPPISTYYCGISLHVEKLNLRNCFFYLERVGGAVFRNLTQIVLSNQFNNCLLSTHHETDIQ